MSMSARAPLGETGLRKPTINAKAVLAKARTTEPVDKENLASTTTIKSTTNSTSVTTATTKTSVSVAVTKRPATAVPAARAVVIPVTKSTASSTVGMKRTASAAQLPAAASAAAAPGAKTAKRAGWDIKGQLEDAVTENKALKETADKVPELEAQLRDKEIIAARLADAEAKYEALVRDMASRDIDSQTAMSKMRIEHAEAFSKLKIDLEGRLAQKEAELRVVDESLRTVTAAKEALSIESQALKGQIAAMNVQMETSRIEHASLQSQFTMSQNTCTSQAATIASLQKELADREATINQLELMRRQDEDVRMQLHNAIQELKGNVRVFCRIRPFLNGEQAHQAIRLMENTDGRGMEVDGPARESADGQRSEVKKYGFQFDRVFGGSSSQNDVFKEISQLVQSALDGYKVCIFAYGQTGSGKTHTMEGSAGEPGMIPLSVQQVFETSRKLADRGWNFRFAASYLEIYNENIRDLLAAAKDNLEIRQDRQGGVYVEDLAVTDVCQPSDVFSLLQKAMQQRTVSATLCNERSSRSHSVFQLRIVGDNASTGEHREGLLNLIDLAGSERLNSSGSTGDRLKETQHINKSLACLGDVIHALANKDKHVPFRNSKLTYLLQNSLGGSSKVLMFLNISPAEDSIPESVNSLRFGAKVNACEIGTARRKT